MIIGKMAIFRQSSCPTTVTLLGRILSMIFRLVRSMTRSVILFLLVISFSIPSAARVYEYNLNCDLGKGNAQNIRVGHFNIALTPENHLCHVAVVGPSKKAVFEYTSTGMQVFAGKDFTGDGEPDAIIQADDFNPYRLFVVSLGSHPGLVKTIENNYGFWLRNDCDDKRLRIWTSDAAFQGDKELVDVVYHYDLMVPEIALELRGTKLVDATPKCKGYFDEQVRLVRSSLTGSDVSRFRSEKIADDFHRGEVKGYILKIVFAYLYSGRENEAHQMLSEMWPQKDIDRIWNWIIAKRSEGTLRQTVPSAE